MSADAALGLVLGLGVALGLIVAVAGWRGWSPTATRADRTPMDPATRRRMLIGLGAAVLVGLVTRWPVAVAATLALVWFWPKLFGGKAASHAQITRIEALATWTESLRDTVTAAAALEQAIPATVDAAPPTLRAPLERLVGMLRAQVALPEALARFADDLDDPTADLVVAALILNAQLRGPQLRQTLDGLADSARGELAMRNEVEAERTALRRGVRIVMTVTLVIVAGLVLGAKFYLQPYNTALGQVVLVVVIGIYVAGFAWLRSLVNARGFERFLGSPAQIRRVADRQMAGGRR